jgi:hypothetical protein
MQMQRSIYGDIGKGNTGHFWGMWPGGKHGLSMPYLPGIGSSAPASEAAKSGVMPVSLKK